MLILPRRYTQQPPAGAVIDWANPITRDLCFAALPHAPINLVNSEAMVTTLFAGYALAARREGRAIVGGTMAYTPPNNASHPAALLFDVSIVTALVVTLQDTASNACETLMRANGSNPAGWLVGIHGGTNNGPYTQLGSSYSFSPSVTYGDTTKPHVCALRGDGAIASTWFDGQMVHSAAYSAPAYEYNPASTGRRVRFGCIGKTGSALNTRPFLGLMWRRALSNIEMLAISLNPWQVFAWARRAFVPNVTVAMPLSATLAQFDRRMKISAWW